MFDAIRDYMTAKNINEYIQGQENGDEVLNNVI